MMMLAPHECYCDQAAFGVPLYSYSKGSLIYLNALHTVPVAVRMIAVCMYAFISKFIVVYTATYHP